jgi:hypothetical protein
MQTAKTVLVVAAIVAKIAQDATLKACLVALPALFYGAVLLVLKAARSRRRMSWHFAAFANKNAHQRRSDLDRYETTAPKSAQKPSLRRLRQIY